MTVKETCKKHGWKGHINPLVFKFLNKYSETKGEHHLDYLIDMGQLRNPLIEISEALDEYDAIISKRKKPKNKWLSIGHKGLKIKRTNRTITETKPKRF